MSIKSVKCNGHKTNGQPCSAWAVTGRTKCQKHGGMTPRGKDSPHYKHGRYSQDIPTRMAARMDAALRDPRLLDLTEDVALLQARLGDVLGQTERGDVAALWFELQTAMQALRDAQAKGADGRVAFIAALNDLQRLIDQGVSEVQRWQEVYKLLNQKAKLSREQQKAMVEAQQTVTVEQVMAFIGAVTSIIREEVGSGEVQQRIGRRVEKLLHAGTVIDAVVEDG